MELREGSHAHLVGAAPWLGGSRAITTATAAGTAGDHARMGQLLLPLVLLQLAAHPGAVSQAAADGLRAQRGPLLHAIVHSRGCGR